MTISFDDFLKVDIRVGTVTRAEPFPRRRSPPQALGRFRPRDRREANPRPRSPVHYAPADLVGRQVLGVVNFPPRQIGPVRSEVLVLGLPMAAAISC
jgi:tRNA-binding protein